MTSKPQSQFTDWVYCFVCRHWHVPNAPHYAADTPPTLRGLAEDVAALNVRVAELEAEVCKDKKAR